MDTENKSTAYGIASFVLGLISVIFFIMPYFALPLAIVGFIFGILQAKRKQTGLGLTGIILNSIGGVIGIAMGLFLLFFVMAFGL